MIPTVPPSYPVKKMNHPLEPLFLASGPSGSFKATERRGNERSEGHLLLSGSDNILHAPESSPQHPEGGGGLPVPRLSV